MSVQPHWERVRMSQAPCDANCGPQDDKFPILPRFMICPSVSLLFSFCMIVSKQRFSCKMPLKPDKLSFGLTESVSVLLRLIVLRRGNWIENGENFHLQHSSSRLKRIAHVKYNPTTAEIKPSGAVLQRHEGGLCVSQRLMYWSNSWRWNTGKTMTFCLITLRYVW